MFVSVCARHSKIVVSVNEAYNLPKEDFRACAVKCALTELCDLMSVASQWQWVCCDKRLLGLVLAPSLILCDVMSLGHCSIAVLIME